MTVVVLAGRRVDAPDAQTPRFPLANVAVVRQRLEAALARLRPRVLVASGAAGTDLLGLQAARRLGAATVMVLPFGIERFRATSVADRPGDWSALYDEMVQVSEVAVLAGPFEDDESAYEAATVELFRLAAERGGTDAVALTVWDGASRGDSDMTARFKQEAERRGIPVEEISTI